MTTGRAHRFLPPQPSHQRACGGASAAPRPIFHGESHMEHALQVEYRPLDDLTPYARNARTHSPEQVAQIAGSIREFGFTNPILTDEQGTIIAGHGRLAAAQKLGIEKVPCITLRGLTDTQRRALILADNRLAENAGWDAEMLRVELEELTEAGADLDLIGFDEESLDELIGGLEDEHADGDMGHKDGALLEKYGVAPFTILDARQGAWKERKKSWHNEIGDDGSMRGTATMDMGRLEKYNMSAEANVSILDPVLSEIICRWFLPRQGSKVFDCFAGDTVFGYVCAKLGHEFTGIELRQEQVDFNTNATRNMNARYICDDGRNVGQHVAEGSQDLLFSCPPYFNLEVYSDLPNDASAQKEYAEFYKIVDEAFTSAARCLKGNRFAVIVCGDVRDKKTGAYYRFPDDIKDTFQRAGFMLYNELVLIDPYGTACIRAENIMKYRKMVKVHQNILVFYKGDAKDIKKEFQKIEVPDAGADME